MKKLFLLAWPIALAAVSCSNEEVVSVNNDANEITFAVVAENGTRAQNVFCNVNKPTNFHVWAAVDNAQYFANASYTDDGTGKFVIDGGSTRYWPDASKTVHFYAVTEETAVKTGNTTETAAKFEGWLADYNAEGTTRAFNWVPNGTSTIKWKTRDTKASKLTDLLYAYTTATRPEYGKATPINFRHALAQIVFKAVNTNTTIDVEIDRVEVVNIAESGVFTMPANVTTTNVNDHTTGGTYPTGSVGSWNIQTKEKNTAANQTYDTEKFGPVQVKSSVTNLTDDDKGVNESGTKDQEGYVAASHPFVANSLLLIPQTTDAWARTVAATKDPDAIGQKGSYFKVYCHIRNIAAADGVVTGTDVDLWGTSAGTKAVYIPFTANWEPGKKYIYTFNFGGNTTGGYDEDGNPVLFPISFNITVDDFVKVDPALPDVDME